VDVRSVLLISRPYQQRRAFAIAQKRPSQVQDFYQRLIDAGFIDRLI
jgi:hypothetical protein